MKIVIGIIAVAVLLAGLVLYLLLMLNSHDLVFCGDIPQGQGASLSVTRIYTSDINANETLSEIINTMNSAENGNISAEEMTQILANYQNIIYAPVFTFNLSQEDSNTYVLTGSIYNGLDENGDPAEPDFLYDNLTLTVGVANGKILAAQNIYSDDVNEYGDPELKERSDVVDPILINNDTQAAFSFKDCSSFRIVFTGVENFPASITLAYTYDIIAENPLNFTHMNDGFLGTTIYADHDERGALKPTLTLERRIISDQP